MSANSLQQSQFQYHPPQVNGVDLPTLTDTFLDSAAALERRLQENERTNQALQDDNQTLQIALRQARAGQAYARNWIVKLRSSHQRASHAVCSRLFREALDNLPQIGKE